MNAKITMQGCIEVNSIHVLASETVRIYSIDTKQKYISVHAASDDGTIMLSANKETLNVGPDRSDTVVQLDIGEGWTLAATPGRYGAKVIAARTPLGEYDWVDLS